MAKVVDKIVDVMTPVGESVFCKINGIVDDYMGQNKYTITMTLGEKEAKALQKQYCFCNALASFSPRVIVMVYLF